MGKVDDMFTKIQQEEKVKEKKGSEEKVEEEEVTEAKQHLPQTVEEAVNETVAQLASTL